MATTTTNLGLTKPSYSDTADIAVINENMDKLDTAVNASEAGLAIMSNNNIIAVATLTDAAMIILAEDVHPDPGVTELAGKKGINLYRSPEAAFPLCAKVAALL